MITGDEMFDAAVGAKKCQARFSRVDHIIWRAFDGLFHHERNKAVVSGVEPTAIYLGRAEYSLLLHHFHSMAVSDHRATKGDIGSYCGLAVIPVALETYFKIH